MKTFEDRFLMLLLAAVAVLLMNQDTNACSCDTYSQPRPDAKNYYTKEFNGSIFTGTVKSITHDPRSELGGITFSQLLIEVDKHWIGAIEHEMTVLVFGPNTTCWVEWKLDQSAFIIAAEYDGRLYLAICDLANWGGSFPGKEWAEYTTSVLGEAKRVKRPE